MCSIFVSNLLRSAQLFIAPHNLFMVHVVEFLPTTCRLARCLPVISKQRGDVYKESTSDVKRAQMTVSVSFSSSLPAKKLATTLRSSSSAIFLSVLDSLSKVGVGVIGSSGSYSNLSCSGTDCFASDCFWSSWVLRNTMPARLRRRSISSRIEGEPIWVLHEPSE